MLQLKGICKFSFHKNDTWMCLWPWPLHWLLSYFSDNRINTCTYHWHRLFCSNILWIATVRETIRYVSKNMGLILFTLVTLTFEYKKKYFSCAFKSKPYLTHGTNLISLHALWMALQPATLCNQLFFPFFWQSSYLRPFSDLGLCPVRPNMLSL